MVVEDVPGERADVVEGIEVSHVRAHDAPLAELVEEGARLVDAVHRVADARGAPAVDDDAVPGGAEHASGVEADSVRGAGDERDATGIVIGSGQRPPGDLGFDIDR